MSRNRNQNPRQFCPRPHSYTFYSTLQNRKRQTIFEQKQNANEESPRLNSKMCFPPHLPGHGPFSPAPSPVSRSHVIYIELIWCLICDYKARANAPIFKEFSSNSNSKTKKIKPSSSSARCHRIRASLDFPFSMSGGNFVLSKHWKSHITTARTTKKKRYHQTKLSKFTQASIQTPDFLLPNTPWRWWCNPAYIGQWLILH